MKKYLLLLLILLASFNSYSSDSGEKPKILKWTFEGALGYYDKASLRRGFRVYNEVCAACHSMNLLTYRKLKDIGYTEDEVKTIASAKNVSDENDEGEIVERPARLNDKFVAPYKNKQASMAANNGAYPPDLSIATKVYEHSGGANYIYSLLTGFEEPPVDFVMPEGKYYNKYFAGHVISMAPPLSDGVLTYNDGTEATIDQLARDVSNFLQWASEPELEERKKMGFQFMVFLVFATIISYLLKKRIWKNVH